MALKRFKNWKGMKGSRKGVFLACVGVCVALGAFFGGFDMAKNDVHAQTCTNPCQATGGNSIPEINLCQSFFYDDDDGFLRYRVYFNDDFEMCWVDIGSNTWSQKFYSDWNTFPFYYAGQVNWDGGGDGWGNWVFMPNKYADMTQSCITFDKNTFYDFYVSNSWWGFNTDNNLIKDNAWSGNCTESKNCWFLTAGASTNGTYYPHYGYTDTCNKIRFFDSEPVSDPNVEVTSPANNQDVTESFLLWFETSGVDLDKWDVVIATVVGVDNKNFEIFRKTFWRDVNSESETFPIRMESMGVGEYTINFEFVDFSTGERFQTDTEFGWSVISYVTGFDDDFLPFSETDQFDNFSGSGFYETYSSYDEPTPMYSKITSLIDPVANWIGRNVQTLSQTFERDVAKNQGAKMTQGIVLVRYYSNSFNDLFGGFPLGDAFISLMFFMIIVACIRLVLAIKKMAK